MIYTICSFGTKFKNLQFKLNVLQLLHITEDILDRVFLDDGEPQLHLIPRTYHSKLDEITTAYKKYCSGIKMADCILANKTKNSNSDFSRFLHIPAVPRRRPDITSFIHKPLEHYRDILKLFNVILGNLKTTDEDYTIVNQIVHDLQVQKCASLRDNESD